MSSIRIHSRVERDKRAKSIRRIICLGSVRTEQIKRTAKELIRRFPDKFCNDFESNKRMVNTLIQGGTQKVKNQIAGYIVRFYAPEETQTPPESSDEGEEGQ